MNEIMNISPNIIITVLAALFTGGFLMLTIENVHLSASVLDRYYSVMKPFFHKLTSYVNYMGMARFHFRFQQTENRYVLGLKQIIDNIANVKGQSAVGLDIPVSIFSAKELDELCEYTIGNVWYYSIEKWNSIKDEVKFDSNYIDNITKEYLCELSNKYNGCEINIELIANISDDFDRLIYQPIQEVPSQFEKWENLEREFRMLCTSSLFLNLLSILIVALFGLEITDMLLGVILIINIVLFVFVFSMYIDMDKKSRIIIRV